MITPTKYPCLSVAQPVGVFFVFVAPAARILPLLAVERRGLTDEERQKVQRALDPKRQRDIAAYVNQPGATFPTSVTLSANSEYVHAVLTAPNTYELVFGTEKAAEDVPDGGDPEEAPLVVREGDVDRYFVALPPGEIAALVIDGQHRIEGLKLAMDTTPSAELATFQVPFAVMFDLTPEDSAKVFVTINSTQRKVDSSHIADLFALSTWRSPQRSAHLMAVAMNEQAGGPFQNGLKMLGKRTGTSEFLSQGSFCKYVVRLFSSKPLDDEQRFRANPNAELREDPRAPLRQFFTSGRDEVILKILENYFSAVREAYPVAWTERPDEYLIRKTVGFSALIRLLMKMAPALLEENDATADAFNRVFAPIRQAIPEAEWASGMLASNDAEATRMSSRMYGVVEDDLRTLIRGSRT